MENINLQELLRLLSPGQGQDLLWSIFLYLIFFFALLTLFLMPDKNMVPTLLTGAVLLMSIIAKVSLASTTPIFARGSFGMVMMNVGMAVLPLIVAGMARTNKRRSKVRGPAIFGGIFGLLYFIMYLIFVTRA